jgi:hypothetical protein
MTKRNIIIAVLAVLGVVVCLCVGLIAFFEINDRLDPVAATALRVTFTAEAATNATATSVAAAQATADVARLDNKELLLEENFDSSTSKLPINCDNEIKDGALQADFSNQASCFSLLGVDLTDFAAEVQCMAYGYDSECGLVFDSQGYSSNTTGAYYIVYLTDQSCYFSKVPTDGPSYTGPFSCNGRDSSHPNLLHVERIHNTLRIFIDGVKMDEFVLDEPVISHGDLGLYMGSHPGQNTPFPSANITVDNLKFWKVP